MTEQSWPGVVVHACNPSTQEAEAGRSWVWGQLGPHIKTWSTPLIQNNPETKTKPDLSAASCFLSLHTASLSHCSTLQCVCHTDSAKRSSPEADDSATPWELQNSETNEVLFFTKYLTSVFCYSNTKWTNTSIFGYQVTLLMTDFWKIRLIHQVSVATHLWLSLRHKEKYRGSRNCKYLRAHRQDVPGRMWNIAWS
jgi:hypothetical protein